MNRKRAKLNSAQKAYINRCYEPSLPIMGLSFLCGSAMAGLTYWLCSSAVVRHSSIERFCGPGAGALVFVITVLGLGFLLGFLPVYKIDKRIKMKEIRAEELRRAQEWADKKAAGR